MGGKEPVRQANRSWYNQSGTEQLVTFPAPQIHGLAKSGLAGRESTCGVVPRLSRLPQRAPAAFGPSMIAMAGSTVARLVLHHCRSRCLSLSVHNVELINLTPFVESAES